MPLIPVVHAFNTSPKEDYKMEETALRHCLTLRFLEAGSPLWTEVEVRASGSIVYFLDLQVEPQFLSLGFY